MTNWFYERGDMRYISLFYLYDSPEVVHIDRLYIDIGNKTDNDICNELLKYQKDIPTFVMWKGPAEDFMKKIKRDKIKEILT